MKFNSQVCTTIEQSKRLLDLGLPGDTADMLWMPEYCARPLVGNPSEVCNIIITDEATPAWSLHRLLKIFYMNTCSCMSIFTSVDGDDEYETLIECIEWCMKNGYYDGQL